MTRPVFTLLLLVCGVIGGCAGVRPCECCVSTEAPHATFDLPSATR